MKLSFNFLNRWESALFGKYGESHVPVSKTIALYAFATAVVSVGVIFIMQMIDISDTIIGVAFGIIGIAALVLAGMKVYRPLQQLSSIGVKIGYAAYMLALFGIIFLVSFYLVMWVLIIALCLVAAYFILVYGVGNGPSKGKKKGRMYYRDGSSEEAEETGRGVLGETYYQGKDSGNTYVD
jgi:peptidoglycan/LPS O-acetylase OafA/YrhL